MRKCSWKSRKKKQELAELLEPVISNEAVKYPRVNMDRVPSAREMVEILKSRIGSKDARKENDHSGPQARDHTAPDLKESMVDTSLS